jgi:hypothetical protein
MMNPKTTVVVAFGFAAVIAAAFVVIMPGMVNAIGPPQGGACGAGDDMATPAGAFCLPDKAGDHVPDKVPEEEPCNPDEECLAYAVRSNEKLHPSEVMATGMREKTAYKTNHQSEELASCFQSDEVP